MARHEQRVDGIGRAAELAWATLIEAGAQRTIAVALKRNLFLSINASFEQ
jgi:hypothetical protein